MSTSGGVTAVYVISVASRLSKLHPQTLRTYERMGFLTPARSSGGVRLYSDEDLALLARIVELAAEGVNLEGVRRILALEAELAELRTKIQDSVRKPAADQSRRR